MRLPLDAQGSGSRLDVDEYVEQCRAIVDVLRVLARFVLVLQMQSPSRYLHVHGGSDAYRTVRFATAAWRGREGHDFWMRWAIRLTLNAPHPSSLYSF
jgi:hypothetical protein